MYEQEKENGAVSWWDYGRAAARQFNGTFAGYTVVLVAYLAYGHYTQNNPAAAGEA